MLSPTIDPVKIEARMKERIKNFIVLCSQNRPAAWPGYQVVVWNGETGLPFIIKNGTWQRYGSEIYLGGHPDTPIPTWGPEVLSAISVVVGINSDPEVQEAILVLASKMAADMLRPLFRNNMIEAFNGMPLSTVAVDKATGIVAAKFRATEDEPEVWRQATGEPVEVTGENWVIITL